MTKSKKSQTATEYMILLAVVLIIALIVVGVLGGIPAIGGTARTRASSSYWQAADIGITAYSFDGDAAGNDDVMVVRNNHEGTITVNSISLEGSQVYSTATVFSPGEEKTLNVNYNCGGNAGDRYTFSVEINYTADETGASYSFNGEGHKLEGTCSQ
jgi:hypothetical protein